MRDRLDTLKRFYGYLSARAALERLASSFEMGGKTFVWNSEQYTVDTALEKLPNYLLDMKCNAFGTLRFFGGPPAEGKWFQGTILTLLCDAYLFRVETRDWTTSERLKA